MQSCGEGRSGQSKPMQSFSNFIRITGSKRQSKQSDPVLFIPVLVIAVLNPKREFFNCKKRGKKDGCVKDLLTWSKSRRKGRIAWVTLSSLRMFLNPLNRFLLRPHFVPHTYWSNRSKLPNPEYSFRSSFYSLSRASDWSTDGWPSSLSPTYLWPGKRGAKRSKV